MPTTTTHGLPIPLPSDPPNLPAIAGALANSLDAQLLSTVTSLPGSPIDGQRCNLLVDSGGAQGGPYAWPLLFRSSGSKWLPVGPTPILIEPDDVALTANTTAVAAGAITIPTAGKYAVGITAAVLPAPSAGDTGVNALVRVNGSNMTETQVRFTSTTDLVPSHREIPMALAAGDTLTIRCNNNGAGNRDFMFMALRARPVLLG